MPPPASVRSLERRLEFRVLAASFLEAAARWLFWSALVVGAAILAARWSLGISAGLAWYSAAVPVVLGVVAGVRSALAARLAPGVAIAWLDRRAGGSGVLITGAERPDPRWDGALERSVERAGLGRSRTLPRVSSERPLRFVTGAAGILLAGVLLGVPKPVALPTELFLPWIERLAERLEALEGLELDPEVVERLAQRLEQLRSTLDESDPSSVYEALDRLAERLDHEAEALAAARTRIDAELASLRTAAERAAAGQGSELALESLAAALTEAAGSGWLGSADAARLRERLSALEAGAFDAAEAAALGEALRERLSSRFGELAASGAFGEQALEQLRGQLAATGPGDAGLAGAVGAGVDGDVGLSRGRGDAPLRFAGETEDQAARFAERALPAATQLDREHSELVARGEAVPEVAPEEGPSGGSATDTSAGARTWRRRVAPRHRRAVRAFFDSNGGAATAGSDDR
ncbi:MAG: hypothetical protein WD226_09060 [Planctomycetota bacterium]